MEHYRVYKLSDDGRGRIIKGKNLEASSDGEAMKSADADDDCPVCEVWRGTKMVGTVDDA